MHPRRSLALLVLCAALAVGASHGCAGPTYVVEQYAGPRRPAETIAILRFGGTDDARLVVVDGERADINIADDARLHVEVLPGEHRVGVISRSDPYAPLQQVAFRAEAGKVYRIVFERGSARAFEVSSGDDTPLRDVTVDRAPQPEPAPRPPPPPEELAPEPPPEPRPVEEPEIDPAALDAGADGAP